MLRLERLRMLMKPGHTTLPVASMTRAASVGTPSTGGPIQAIRSPAIPALARITGAHQRPTAAVVDLAAGDHNVEH